MAGGNKAFQPLVDQPLLAHVIARMQPQCSRLFVSVEVFDPQWQSFGLTQVADPYAGSNGPLGGLLAALQAVQHQSEWLLLVPCDAPFLPLDLAARLLEAAAREQKPAALVSWQGQWQPTFSLWHASLLPDLRAATDQQGMRGLKEFLLSIPQAVMPWPERRPPPFFNINTAQDLAVAAEFYRELA